MPNQEFEMRQGYGQQRYGKQITLEEIPLYRAAKDALQVGAGITLPDPTDWKTKERGVGQVTFSSTIRRSHEVWNAYLILVHTAQQLEKTVPEELGQPSDSPWVRQAIRERLSLRAYRERERRGL